MPMCGSSDFDLNSGGGADSYDIFGCEREGYDIFESLSKIFIVW